MLTFLLWFLLTIFVTIFIGHFCWPFCYFLVCLVNHFCYWFLLTFLFLMFVNIFVTDFWYWFWLNFSKLDNKKVLGLPGLFYKKIPVNPSPFRELFTGIGLSLFFCLRACRSRMNSSLCCTTTHTHTGHTGAELGNRFHGFDFAWL